MLNEHLFVNITFVLMCFVVCFLASAVIIVGLRSRTGDWKPPRPRMSPRTLDEGVPFCSDKETKNRYLDMLAGYAVPRAFYVSSLLTTLIAYLNLKFISTSTFSVLIFGLFVVFLMYISDPRRADYF